MGVAPATLKFLKDLHKNNARDWFLSHKEAYESAMQDVKHLRDDIVKGLSKKDVIEDGKIFRIYRDVRFSKDKAPYKNNFGIHFTRSGPMRRGGFYLQIEPGNSFAGGGFWAPEPNDLRRIREELAFDAAPLRKIIASKSFQHQFGTLQGEELKTAPSGFERDHPAIDLIRKKQFLVSRKFTDKEVLAPDFVKQTVATFAAMLPFFDYMSEVLTTNLNGEKITGTKK